MLSNYVRRVRGKRLQKEFAHLIGVSVQTIQNWEQGTYLPNGPSWTKLQQFAREERVKVYRLVLDHPVYGKSSWLFTNEEDARKSYDFSYGRDQHRPEFSIYEEQLRVTWTDLRLPK